ncbi:uncharacterized protein METZ01_LOCUS155569 [marine metagenome]|uniref:Uncharacterized protein n=1 Tax=marine metagenome TaxID=408172 RepID=A0A382AMC1_9ZZZZ
MQLDSIYNYSSKESTAQENFGYLSDLYHFNKNSYKSEGTTGTI